MDEIVTRAMQRWPNVPAVYGWLQLDRRGNWRIKTKDGRFEPIVNPTMIEFIGRNYTHDDTGRWYFQNGPQCVFVALDYTPLVYRLNDNASALCAHTGAAPAQLRAIFFDDAGNVLIETELGIGLLLDRDLDGLLTQLSAPNGAAADALLEIVDRGGAAQCRLFGQTLSAAPIRATEVSERFGFNPRPAPAPGMPDC